jgi:hypothetical protein
MVNQRGDGPVNDTELREIYAGLMARSGKGRARCPSPEAIQALVVREGDEATRLATLDHVMSCRECRAELDLLRSIEAAGSALDQSARRPERRWLMPAALAASVLFAFLVGRSALTRHPVDELRSGPANTAAVVLVAPGTEVAAGEPVSFAWRLVDGASRYRLEVLDSAGNMAVEAETADTTVTLNSVASLAAGTYQWWVIAMTPRPGPRSALRPLHLIAK